MNRIDELDHLELPPAPPTPAAFIAAVRARRRRRIALRSVGAGVLCLVVASVSVLAIRDPRPGARPEDSPRIVHSSPVVPPEAPNPRVVLAWQGIGDPPPIPQAAPPLRLGFASRESEIDRILRQ